MEWLENSHDFVDKFVRKLYNPTKDKEGVHMSITATELKTNLGKYLLMAATEDVLITKNGKTVAKLTSPYQDKLDIVDSLYGSIPADISLDDVRTERLEQA